MSDSVLLTTGQAAQALGVSASTVCRWSSLGAPCSYTIGNHRRWDLDELRAWVDEQAEACEADQDEDDLGSSDETEDAETCEHCGAELEDSSDELDEEEEGSSDELEEDDEGSSDELDEDDD